MIKAEKSLKDWQLKEAQYVYDFAKASEPMITCGVEKRLSGIPNCELIGVNDIVETASSIKKTLNDHNLVGEKAVDFLQNEHPVLKYVAISENNNLVDRLTTFIDVQLQNNEAMIGIQNPFLNEDLNKADGITCTFMSKTGQLYDVSFKSPHMVMSETLGVEIKAPSGYKTIPEFRLDPREERQGLESKDHFIDLNVSYDNSDRDTFVIHAEAFDTHDNMLMERDEIHSTDKDIACETKLKTNSGYAVSVVTGYENGRCSEEKYYDKDQVLMKEQFPSYEYQ